MTTTAIKSLIRVTDLDLETVNWIVDRATTFRENHRQGKRRENILDGKSVALIFEKPSLRTRVAFELGAKYLGGEAVYLSSQQIFASGGDERGRESIPDISRVLERFVDLIVVRAFMTQTLDDISRVIENPVVNALCDSHHPTQALADLMTMRSFKGTDKLKVAFVGDGNNVANSLLQICAINGHDFSIASPKNYEIPVDDRTHADTYAKVSGSKVSYVESPFEAVEDADVVYTDTFVSMGEEHLKTGKLNQFVNYMVDGRLMGAAKKDAIFMHCLPAHRGEEVTNEVIESKQSVVFDQAECRMHVAKAIIAYFLESR